MHVFSLASGHLYERFLRIMMLSVTKRCSRPVKFWLVENFLSPSFKDMVPHMARAVGFQVELVTYKWPSWLREQTEKQRIIWGYKVLFMDVLFPLGLNKVVYVDADQVVRADIAELWDMDLQDHVYAYTPFCTSNKVRLRRLCGCGCSPQAAAALLAAPPGDAPRCRRRRWGTSSGAAGFGRSTCRGSRTTLAHCTWWT